MSNRERRRIKLQNDLDEWRLKIERLKQKAANAEPHAQVEYRRQIKELRTMRQSVERDLAELNSAGENDWEDLMKQVSGERGIHSTLK